MLPLRFNYFIILSGKLSHYGRVKIWRQLMPSSQKKHKVIQKSRFQSLLGNRTRMPENELRSLSLEDKAGIVSWRDEGVPVAIITNRLGHHRSSIKRLDFLRRPSLCLHAPFLLGKRALGALL
jgi:hypothetical protein